MSLKKIVHHQSSITNSELGFGNTHRRLNTDCNDYTSRQYNNMYNNTFLRKNTNNVYLTTNYDDNFNPDQCKITLNFSDFDISNKNNIKSFNNANYTYQSYSKIDTESVKSTRKESNAAYNEANKRPKELEKIISTEETEEFANNLLNLNEGPNLIIEEIEILMHKEITKWKSMQNCSGILFPIIGIICGMRSPIREFTISFMP